MLHALGLSSEDILAEFYNNVSYVRGPNGWQIPYVSEQWRGQKPMYDVINADTGEVMFKSGEKITPRKATAAAKEGLKNLLIPTEEIFGRYSAFDLINEKTGEIYIEAGDEVSAETSRKSMRRRSTSSSCSTSIMSTPARGCAYPCKGDKARTPTTIVATSTASCAPAKRRRARTPIALFYGLFFDSERTTFAQSAEVKSTCDSASTSRTTVTHLRAEDILAVVKETGRPQGRQGRIETSTISQTAAVRAVGELLENQYRVGCAHGGARQGADELGRRVSTVMHAAR